MNWWQVAGKERRLHSGMCSSSQICIPEAQENVHSDRGSGPSLSQGCGCMDGACPVWVKPWPTLSKSGLSRCQKSLKTCWHSSSSSGVSRGTLGCLRSPSCAHARPEQQQHTLTQPGTTPAAEAAPPIAAPPGPPAAHVGTLGHHVL